LHGDSEAVAGDCWWLLLVVAGSCGQWQADAGKCTQLAGSCRQLQAVAGSCRQLQAVAGSCRQLQAVAPQTGKSADQLGRLFPVASMVPG